jgi:hypothetical protein
LVRALDSQTDLRQLPPEDGVLVWANAAWVPANGAGTVASAGGGSKTGRLIGVAAALVAVFACLAEGVTRRRRAGRRRAGVVAAAPPAAPLGAGPAEQEGLAHELGPPSTPAESPPEQAVPEAAGEASPPEDVEVADSPDPRAPAVGVDEGASEVAAPIVPVPSAGAPEESEWR